MSHLYIKFSHLWGGHLSKNATRKITRASVHIKKYTMFAFLSHFWHLGAGRRAAARSLLSLAELFASAINLPGGN